MTKHDHLGIGMTSQRTRDRLINRLKEQGITDPRVLDTMRVTPRHIFVEEALSSRAYEDTALPIGYGQTISQPYVVARMTEALLAGGPLNKVLEIGAGCGYQTAILAQLVGYVYSVERIAPLVEAARRNVRELRLRNVRIAHNDGSWGWTEYAPYDGILAAAAPEHVPEALLGQLAVGGRLVIPVGPQGKQQLTLIIRREEGFEHTVLEQVSFVPMLRGPR
ncbi:MAG: protein-L-isoaspartate(D-aspartate) O-methyltransferase [Pseudomonadota bacterium]